MSVCVLNMRFKITTTTTTTAAAAAAALLLAAAAAAASDATVAGMVQKYFSCWLSLSRG